MSTRVIVTVADIAKERQRTLLTVHDAELHDRIGRIAIQEWARRAGKHTVTVTARDSTTGEAVSVTLRAYVPLPVVLDADTAAPRSHSRANPLRGLASVSGELRE